MLLLPLIHGLGALAMFVGMALLFVWAVKTLSMNKLMQWGVGLVIGGLLVSMVTMGVLRHGGTMKFSRSTMMNGRSMHDMHGMDSMKDMDHGSMNHDDMTMGDMTAMLEGKTGDAFDEAFLRMMIPHHQGAIDMVKNVETNAKHQEIKDLAKGIAIAQQREIDMMNGWLQAWGYND